MHTYVRRALQTALVSGGLIAGGAVAAYGAPGTELWLVVAALLLLVLAAVWLRGRTGRAATHHPSRVPFVPHQRGPSDGS